MSESGAEPLWVIQYRINDSKIFAMEVRFGDIIGQEDTVLLCFYAQWNASSEILPTLREVAVIVGDTTKIYKFDVDENRALVKVLSIEALPTFMLYRKGVLQWRSEQFYSSDALVRKLLPNHRLENNMENEE